MKTLTVVSHLRTGGVPRAAAAFARCYREIGLDSRCWATRDSGVRQKELERVNVPLTVIDPPWEAWTSWVPDSVHLHTNGLAPELVSKIRRVFPSAVLLEQNVFSQPQQWDTLLDHSWHMSHSGIMKYRALGGTAPASVLPNPVATESFYPDEEAAEEFRSKAGIPKDAILIGRVGQASTYKWSPWLIRAFRILMLKHPKLHLVVVGAPPILLPQIQRLPADRRTVLPGVLNDNQLRGVYSSLEVMLHYAAQGESFGYALVESMLCQTPVVSVSTPWADNAQTEVVYPPLNVCRDFRTSVSVTHRLLTDPSSASNAGIQGRRYALDNFQEGDVARRSVFTMRKERRTPPAFGASVSSSTTIRRRTQEFLGPKFRLGSWRWLPRQIANRTLDGFVQKESGGADLQ